MLASYFEGSEQSIERVMEEGRRKLLLSYPV
jgi:hypothetical protein